MMKKMLESWRHLNSYSLDAAKRFAEIQGDKHMNVVLNELIGKGETLKCDKILLKNTIESYHNFSSKKSKFLYSGHFFQVPQAFVIERFDCIFIF